MTDNSNGHNSILVTTNIVLNVPVPQQWCSTGYIPNMTKIGHYSCADTHKSKDLLVHVIKTYHWSRGIAPLILNLNTK